MRIDTSLVVLRPEEAKRLVGEAVACLPQVKRAARQGRMVVVGGSTTRHVVRALTGTDPGLAPFSIGWIRQGRLGESPQEGRGPGPFLFDHGKVSRGWPGAFLETFGGGDIYVKGANALDPAGNVGILMASPTGGTIGAALTILMARGGELIIPVTHEKLVPSVFDACRLLGQQKVGRVMGAPVGMMPIPAAVATVVTEVTAFAHLFGVQAVPVAAGGLDDCVGATAFHLSGAAQGVDAAWDWVQALRGEEAG